MVAQLKANGVKESDDIAVLVHLSTLSSSTISERVSSIVANWNHFAPINWKLVPEYIVNYGDEVSAVKLVEEKLKKTPNVKGIIACNNGSTNASVEAVMAAGRKDVAVTGFDLGKKLFWVWKARITALLLPCRTNIRWVTTLLLRQLLQAMVLCLLNAT